MRKANLSRRKKYSDEIVREWNRIHRAISSEYYFFFLCGERNMKKGYQSNNLYYWPSKI